MSASLCPLPTCRDRTIEPKFPFFYFVSTCLDELVESVHIESLLQGCSSDEISMADCFDRALSMLQNNVNDGKESIKNHARYSLIGEAISFVTNLAPGCNFLFERYLSQFIEWKVGCEVNPGFLQWLSDSVQECGYDCAGNILAIHVVARLKKIKVLRLSSIVSFSNTCSLTLALGDGGSLFEILFDSIEIAVSKYQSLKSVPWCSLFSAASDSALTRGKSFDTKSLSCRLRRLSFIAFCKSLGCKNRAGDDLLSLNSVCDLSVKSLLESLNHGELDQKYAGSYTDRVFQKFLSPMWLNVTRLFWLEDLSELLNSIVAGCLTNRHLSVGLLRGASQATESAPNKFDIFSVNALLLVNEQIVARNLAQFSELGRRECLPHYIPLWLRKSPALILDDDGVQVQRDSDAMTAYVSNYGHCFDGALSDIVFELFLSTFSSEAVNLSSEQMYILFALEVESELSLDQRTFTQLARQRKLGKSNSLRGTPLASLALSARLTCWIAKIASEVSVGMSSQARDIVPFIDMVMALPMAAWQEFFVSTILRFRGEGTLSTALVGPLSVFRWSRCWIDGIPESRLLSAEALHQAEAALSSATAEEERKIQEFRHCPHCQQTFIVAERNCGRFLCGQDFHAGNGQAHGCRREFLIDHAPRYVFDESIVTPLRAQIEVERSKLGECQLGEKRWERARSLVIPQISVAVTRNIQCESIIPCLYLLPSTSSSVRSGPIDLMKVLWEASSLTERLTFLPDFIEVCRCCACAYSLFFVNLTFLIGQSHFFNWSIALFVFSFTFGSILLSVFWCQVTLHIQQLWGT